MNLKSSMLCITLMFATLFCSSQSYRNKLIPYRKGSLWGFCDSSSNIKISPSFDKVDPFGYNDSITRVYKDNKMSFINSTGKLLIPYFDSVRKVRSKFFFVKKEKASGIYDVNGNEVAPLIYDELTFPYVDDVEGNSSDFVIGTTRGQSFLINIYTRQIKEYSKPKKSLSIHIDSGVVLPRDNLKTITTIKAPDDGIFSKYPKINRTYESIEVAGVLSFDEQHSFRFFKVYKNGQFGYVGENGIEYFRK